MRCSGDDFFLGFLDVHHLPPLNTDKVVTPRFYGIKALEHLSIIRFCFKIESNRNAD
jgi:uncharacterized protein YfdQ (DUF2303 family)